MTDAQVVRVGDQIMTLDPGVNLAERAYMDFYPTPARLCKAALKLLPQDCRKRRVLDPGAGAGAWGKAARDLWGEGVFIHGVEIRSEALPAAGYSRWSTCNFLDMRSVHTYSVGAPHVTDTLLFDSYDLVIGNPPYGKNAENQRDNTIAARFVKRSLELTRPGGYVVFLLLGSFLESSARYRDLWKANPPKAVYFCVQRPSFKPGWDRKKNKARKNGTDARMYAVFIWQKPEPTETVSEESFMAGWLNWNNKEND